jgi:periplasmic divalent cation tolerance protein
VVDSAGEWMLVIKTSRELFSRVPASLEGVHSYEVPEVIALPAIDGSVAYLAWMEGELSA